VAIAVTNYATWETLYVGEDGGEIPLVFYAYPDHEDEAREAWTEPTRESMEVFEKLFGPYPFRREMPEKYGTAEFHWTSGAEEHQTLCSFGSGFVDSTHGSDWVVAHELSHQWFGDAVTPNAYHETWTKEGVASYCEALYFEHRELLRGNTPEAARDALINHMEGMRWPERFDDDIMGNPEEPYSLVSVYHRGAWVLHMLRRIMGDDSFYLFLRSFMERHLYGNAGTDEMAQVAEEVYGGDLRWFFEPWVYTNARPHISYEWTSRSLGGALWEIHLHTEQTQEAPPFRLPLDLRISGKTDERREEIWLEGRWQDFTFQTDFGPQSVEIDPDRWYLAQIEPLPQTASGVVLRTPAPNPVAGGTDVAIRYRIPSPGEATLDLLDVTGRRIGSIESGSRPEGWQIFRWDGLMNGDRPASGIYWLRLQHSGKTATEKIVILQ
jgi:aminopeptidase N